MDEELRDAHANKKGDKDCPQCGGTMVFDPATGALFCPYCEYREELKNEPTPDTKVSEQDFLSAENAESFHWGENKKQVICRSCGAQSVYDALDTAAVCPFCGANHVMEPNNESSIPPTGVIPFAVSEEQAQTNFKGWLKGKLFAPKAAKQSARPESFKGIYMPYWTYDSQTESDYTARYGIDRQVKDKEGKVHTETDWFRTSGDYSRFIDDQLVFASNRHDSGIMRSVEPFVTDLKTVKPYTPEYLSGFISERYSIGLKDGWNVAKQAIETRLRNEISNEIRRLHHADRVDNLNVSTVFSDITYKYLLVPVWQSAFTYKGKVYQFMVNGQNGKVGGRTPVSAIRVILFIAAIAAVLFLLYKLIGG